MKELEFFVGRQPILKKSGDLLGYELLFRGGFSANTEPFNANYATATVIQNSMMGVGLCKLVGQDRKAFINFPQSFFSTPDNFSYFPKDVVIEVLEDVEPTPKVISTLRELKNQGRTIALDDFIFKKKYLPFIELADIIKLDIEVIKPESLAPLIRKVKDISGCRIVTERVETKDQFQNCLEAGSDFFQGYYFAKPEIVSGKKLNVSQLSVLMLIQKLNMPSIGLQQIIEVVEKDVSLVHKLIKIARYYQSQAMANFSTIRDILMLFGIERVKSWATLLAMTGMDHVVPEVMKLALIRASFMRRYALATDKRNPESYYLAGLFSFLDVLLKAEMNEVLADLPIADEIKAGLLNTAGEIGEAIALIKRFEHLKVKQDESHLNQLYFDAVEEAEALSQKF